MRASCRAGMVAVVAIALMATASCSSDGSSDDDTAHALATELVEQAHATGVAPRLTVDTAEALYGTDAANICDAFDGGLSTAERTLILGNPAHGRRKTITVRAVRYGRLVVKTYCPEHLDDFDHAVKELDPLESRNP